MNGIEQTTNKKKIIFSIIGGIIGIGFIACFVIAFINHQSNKSTNSNSSEGIEVSSDTITKGGTYNITGNNSCIVVNTKDKVELTLEDATITCDNAPAINVLEADEVSIILTGENIVNSTTTEDLDGAIYSKADLIFFGSGTLNVTSNYDGIVSKDDLIINGGTYTIKASDDGIRGKDSVEITDGTFNITANGDGIKSTNEEDSSKGYVNITGGTFTINSSNDSIQAETNLTIKAGTFNIKTTGSITSDSDSAKGLKAGTLITLDGGTFSFNTTDDAIHSNGNIIVNNGEYEISTKDDGFHADDTLTINDGTINITSCYEGFEGSKIYLKGGNNSINASDDGINAASSDSSATQSNGMNGRDHFKNSTGLLEISGGTTKVISAGDGLDSNGTITLSGGTIYVESSNQGPEEAIDHVGAMTITGGTIISLSKNMANDDGTKTSSIPYLNTSINSGSGKITIGNLSYTPTTSGYRYIFIASDSLSSGSSTLFYGSNSTSVSLTTGTVNSTGNQMGGQMGGPRGR